MRDVSPSGRCCQFEIFNLLVSYEISHWQRRALRSSKRYITSIDTIPSFDTPPLDYGSEQQLKDHLIWSFFFYKRRAWYVSWIRDRKISAERNYK